jgi:putative transposase
MHFYPEQLFHIYNQGNNRQTIFFTDENYEFFLWKMRAYLLPFGDFIAYCLMPTHFHWQFYVRQVELERKGFREHVDSVEMLRRQKKFGQAATAKATETRPAKENSIITLNESIGIMQKAYTRAINQEKGWTGSLFRKECKAKDGWIDEFITLRKMDGKLDYRFVSGTDYAFTCLSYIHENPKEAGLVKEITDWKYSSAMDYAGLRKGSLCNIDYGKKILGLV